MNIEFFSVIALLSMAVVGTTLFTIYGRKIVRGDAVDHDQFYKRY